VTRDLVFPLTSTAAVLTTVITDAKTLGSERHFLVCR
jgi:hypothetical protein